jgi:hypothetical protein
MASDSLRLDEPVIILTCGRSGSTLLRFLLNAHPELACPPETGLVNLCANMAMQWNTLAMGNEPASALTEEAKSAIRAWVNTTFGSYLNLTKKRRLCEKSIGAAESAAEFLGIFPRAKYICLYRNCIDVIDSVLEACPWGLSGYGLDSYVSAHPGNSVAAAADYWLTRNRMISDFQRAHSEACMPMRYEDLVGDPEGEMARVFDFLGEARVPGVARLCFELPQQERGPADHKIWSTSTIHSGSIGRGRRVPRAAIPPLIAGMIADLLSQLGYTDDNPPASPRALAPGVADTAQEDAVEILADVETLLIKRMSTEASLLGESSLPFTVSATAPLRPAGVARSSWAIRGGEVVPLEAERQDCLGVASIVDVVGDASDWIAILTDRLNLGSAARQGLLRYVALAPVPGDGTPGTARFDEISRMLARRLARNNLSATIMKG